MFTSAGKASGPAFESSVEFGTSEEEDGSDGGAVETLRTPGGRVATVLERRARGWVYVELDGNANDEGGAHERKSFRNSQLS